MKFFSAINYRTIRFVFSRVSIATPLHPLLQNTKYKLHINPFVIYPRTWEEKERKKKSICNWLYERPTHKWRNE
jgi:hypothetical protein